MDMTPPVLRVGWSTDQAANSKDLSFRLNPSYFQSNPRLGKNNGYTAVAPTLGGGADWRLFEVYDLPALTAAVGTTPEIPASKYCVTVKDWGRTNALPLGTTLTPHMCSSGNVATGATAAQGLQTSLALAQWYVTPPTVNILNSAKTVVPATVPAIPNTEYGPWQIPCWPT